MDEICVVAVGVGPVVWAVQCEICDDIVSYETEDGDEADRLEAEHVKFHLDKANSNTL